MHRSRTVKIECGSSTVSYVVIATSDAGGINELLRAVHRERIAFNSAALTLSLSAASYADVAVLEPGDWPAAADRTL
ncbi:hypothetical protein D3Y57_17835 [Sphingomonas paeninsulae]|uniref:Uncharacterized protein n=1 Tax=Sphingomonas paeninsulae TaxID=2319844 RepID=A0A494TPQ6_SPHPE|nr:hypothetical protein [Sphingomonas paeninsulae]AYJ87448.1 hypothetical protein D3Y57_17835 [Sphingomonas paeninsulae]